MKIAVASNDGVSISQHFGRSKCFIVFDVQNKNVENETVRSNTHTAHAKGECDGHHNHEHNHEHSHADIAAALSDCTAVLCYGMGWRAAEALRDSGTEPFVIDGQITPREAVEQYVTGHLKPASDFCRCH
ncbi:Dinitrogenase iron-molybdenum cofactor [Novipirellula aureliae]|uniref:Dinitrogenase iron-molybdenum cofactor n=1 Tax=Novipirellula aureliae TaxID=2527966 RepID=A0A5C6E8Q9_9BACT|nr:NifB/NifX family molybdenum-iron cluster-binding protein [Novipirellula aureliae]TWU44317.1 Dinitrogenase iron-molybdenum cofactor [Novipirellula aureliae]